MNKPIDVTLYFNFRSPYCYLLSKTMWPVFDDFDVNLVWRPVGGWNLRSSPERAKKKLPIARQDLKRFAKRLGIPVNPPPMETEPTPQEPRRFTQKRKVSFVSTLSRPCARNGSLATISRSTKVCAISPTAVGWMRTL